MTNSKTDCETSVNIADFANLSLRTLSVTKRVFKVHTDTLGRLIACLRYGMYGVTETAMKGMPTELLAIETGDIVFISEKEVSNNALFGPFYVTDERDGIVVKKAKGCWKGVDLARSEKGSLAYWVELENRIWCLLFDKTLIDRISIVWPYNWQYLRVKLPSWGLVSGPDSEKLIDFAIQNEQKAKEFFKKHDVWV